METKKELIKKINHLFKAIGGLFGIIIMQSFSIHWWGLWIGFFIGGLFGWIVQPYNEKGEHRY